MMTKRGIELNLKESSFKYDYLGLSFYFSSKLYLEKFKENVSNYINMESLKICNNYKIPIMINRYLAIAYYKKIEKRGFRIVENDEEIERLIFDCNFLS